MTEPRDTVGEGETGLGVIVDEAEDVAVPDGVGDGDAFFDNVAVGEGDAAVAELDMPFATRAAIIRRKYVTLVASPDAVENQLPLLTTALIPLANVLKQPEATAFTSKFESTNWFNAASKQTEVWTTRAQ